MCKDISEYAGLRFKNKKDIINANYRFILGNPEGFVASMGDGGFVVYKSVLQELDEQGIEYKMVELVEGVPKEVREYLKEKYLGVIVS